MNRKRKRLMTPKRALHHILNVILFIGGLILIGALASKLF